jgi:hypothetical protein
MGDSDESYEILDYSHSEFDETVDWVIFIINFFSILIYLLNQKTSLN